MLREPKPILDADQIGIDALTFIASHKDLLNRFVDLTGFDASQLCAQAARPEFFVGVLDSFSPTSRTFLTWQINWRCRRRRSGWRETLWRRRPASLWKNFRLECQASGDPNQGATM
jgi:hypothetical protein